MTAVVSATATTGGSITAGGTWTFTTAAAATADGVCPCSIFQETARPAIADAGDPAAALTLGVKFSPSVNGTVSAVRFYKSAGNTGTHAGSIWNSAGTRIATATFSNESSAGWQSVSFGSPVTVAAGETYTASYTTTVGAYSVTPGAYSTAGLTRGPLSVPVSGGAFTYGPTTSFPGSISTSDYLVDVVFSPTVEPLSITSQVPAAGTTGVDRAVSPSVTLSAPLQTGYSIALTNGSTTIASTNFLSTDGKTITVTPTAAFPAAATITVTLSNARSTTGQALATQTWSFTTANAPAPAGTSLFASEIPATAAANDSGAVELGVSFTPSVAGSVTALKFHKGTGNSGTHVGSLWSSAGVRLAQVTFTNETATGWQTATLSTPVALTAGQTYVASYLAPVGRYSVTSNYFTTAKTVGPLTAGATTNGRFLYGTAGGFPSNSYAASNYFVDVIFASN